MANSNISYGSLTIVDITDLGEFSVYPMSNLPLTVVSDPNTNQYTPNWQTSNLTISPVCYYAGQSVTPKTVTYTVQKNAETAVAISSTNGEAKSGNDLKVTKNRFSDSSINMLTYYVTATYTEPDTNQTLTASGQITFSIVRHASNVKTCVITGENVFKYDTTGKISGSGTITLTGTVNNVTISKWQYKKSDGTWADYPNGTITNATLTVNATDSVFVNDVATIRLTTSDSNIYDICSIVNLRDGAAGTDTVSAVLSNEDQMIPCNSSGTPTSYSGAVTTITIYEGGQDVTSSWTITPTTTNITGTWAEATYTYTVTGISADTGYVTFTCSRSGYADIVKTFNLLKMKTGANGTSPTIYTLEPSTLAFNKNISNAYSPATVTFRAYSQTGSAARAAYAGRFKIYTNGGSTAVYTSASNESSYTYTPSGDISTIKCELYVAGGGGSAVDTQTIVVTSDGATGATGKGITSTTIKYATNSSGVTYPTTETDWKDTIPTVSEGNYLWTRTTYTYSSGSPTTSYSVSKMGVSGTSISIKSTSVEYVSSTSGTSAPSTGWQSTVPTVAEGSYLWTKTVVTYSDNTSTTSYSVGKMGAKGDNAINVVVGNEATQVACTSEKKVSSATDVTIPFAGYSGTSRVACTVAVNGTLPTGITVKSNTASTTSADGSIVLTIAKDCDFGGTTAAYDSIDITFTYTCSSKTFTKVLSLSKSLAPINGTSPTNIICGNESVTLACTTGRLTSVASDITIPFAGYVGTNRAECSVTYSTLPSGVTLKSNTAATDSADGSLVLSVAKSANLGGTTTAYDNVDITLTFTCNSKTFTRIFSISKTVTGATGTAACNVAIGNHSDTIPCTSGGLAAAAFTITIPFRGYQGTSAKYTTATVSGDIFGANSTTKITPTITNATSAAEGSIVYSIPANALIGNAASVKTGEITVTYTVTNGTTAVGATTLATISQKYTWVKTNAAVNGTNAIMMDIYAANGDIIQNASNNVILTARLMNGASQQTSSVSYAWYQYKSDSTASDKYDSLGTTTQSLTVTPSMVDGFASFKCIATYSSKNYVAYYSVRDLQDPLQVTLYSSIGDKLTNGYGNGYVYAIARQNGNVIDELPEIVTKLSDATGTKCYLVDSANKTVTYKSRTSTSTSTWATATPSLGCTYEWTFRDKNGNATTFNSLEKITAQIFYIDGSLINKKTIFDIKVTKN